MTLVSLSSGSEEPLDALWVGTRRVVSGPFSVGTWRVSSSSPKGPVLRRSSRPSSGLSLISTPLRFIGGWSFVGQFQRFYPAHARVKPHRPSDTAVDKDT